VEGNYTKSTYLRHPSSKPRPLPPSLRKPGSGAFSAYPTALVARLGAESASKGVARAYGTLGGSFPVRGYKLPEDGSFPMRRRTTMTYPPRRRF
jgi:hypothetical protein